MRGSERDAADKAAHPSHWRGVTEMSNPVGPRRRRTAMGRRVGRATEYIFCNVIPRGGLRCVSPSMESNSAEEERSSGWFVLPCHGNTYCAAAVLAAFAPPTPHVGLFFGFFLPGADVVWCVLDYPFRCLFVRQIVISGLRPFRDGTCRDCCEVQSPDPPARGHKPGSGPRLRDGSTALLRPAPVSFPSGSAKARRPVYSGSPLPRAAVLSAFLSRAVFARPARHIRSDKRCF
jgi:hypothetical protein